MSYVTVAEFKAAVGVGDTYDDANIQRSLDAASDWIDKYCGRVFLPQDSVPTARIFDANRSGAFGGYGQSGPPFGWFYGFSYGYPGMDRLDVPDVASVTTIELDLALNGSFSTSLPSSAWMLYPLSVGQPGVVGNYTQIRLRPMAPYAFWPGYQVRVTGIWGWPTADAPPNQVRQANVLLANRYFRRPNVPFGIWEGPQLGQLAILPTADPDVVQLLQPYQTSHVWPKWVAA